MNTVTIPAITLPDGSMSLEQQVDLTPYQGQTARIYLTADGRVQVNPPADCWWQMAEVVLPPEQKETTEEGEVGAVIPLDLSTVDIKFFDLPEVQ